MMLSYSLKVLFANFTNMWKILLYRIIVMVLTLSLAAGLMLPTLSGLVNSIQDTGFFVHISEFLASILQGNVGSVDYSVLFKDDISAIYSILIKNVGSLVWAYVSVVLLAIFSRFMNGVADFAVCDVVNSNMSAKAKFGFTSCILKNLRKAARFSITKVLFTIPFDVAIGTLAGYLFVALIGPLSIFMPFFVTILTICLASFRLTLFSGWLPAVVTDGNSVYGGLRKSMTTVFSRFGRIYSTWVIVLCMILLLGMMLAIFTFGVGLIILAPTVILFTVIFYLVMYYGAEGKRYYIDHETIVTPKLLHDREQAVSYQVQNNVFFDNTHSEDSEEDSEHENKD